MTDKSNIENLEADAELNFRKACALLDKYNLKDLLCLNSSLSCLDYFSSIDGTYTLFFPMLNYEKVSLVSKSILASKSREYKELMFESATIPQFFNHLSHSTYYSGLNDESIPVDQRLLKFMAEMANSQLPAQKVNVRYDLARAYILYYLLPVEYEKSLRRKHGKNFVNIPEQFEAIHGISIPDYLILCITLFSFYVVQHGKYLAINTEKLEELKLDIAKHSNPERLQTRLFLGLVNLSKKFRDQFTFTPEMLDIPGAEMINLKSISKFLTLVSRTPVEFGRLQKKPPFNQGTTSSRISPLQRYPVVSLQDNKYIVPNIRYFESSIQNTIHFQMQEAFPLPGNEFNQTFGSVFEKYPELVLSKRLPKISYIPEISYKKKSHFDGPDLTILDTESKRLLVIEIKSKRFSLETRLSPMSNSLDSDLERVYSALEALPNKISDIYAGLTEYSQWQSDIDSLPIENSICIVLVSGSLNFLPELINQQRLKDDNHFLNGYPYPYVIMTIENYEHAVEIAHDQKNSLGELMLKYYQTSLITGAKESAAEFFDNVTLDSDDYFLKEYIEKILTDAGLSKGSRV